MPSELYTMFKKMSDSDLHLLGLSDKYTCPEWMIITVLPVPPPPMHSSIIVDGGTMWSEDNLTYRLGDIIKASENPHPPYNANFNGDEMNMYIPPSEETYTFLDWTQVHNIILWIPDWDSHVPTPAIIKPKPLWIGKMMIDNGEILFGTMDKKMVGAMQGNLVCVVLCKNSPEATCQVFTGIQMVVNYWLILNGLSIGIGGMITGPKVMSFIMEKIMEKKQKHELNHAQDDSGQYTQKNLKVDNNIKQMQSVEGKCIPFRFCHCTLPHFNKDNFSPEARGFMENSYLQRLMPQEYFFHGMAGQEGLIDMAVKTAEMGYIQKRLVKALKDIMVHYDRTVCNSLSNLVQLIYSKDGMDGTFIEQQKIDMFVLSNKEFEHKYHIDMMDKEGGFLLGVLQIGINDSSLELQAKLDEEYRQLVQDRRELCMFIFPHVDGLTPHYMPVNLYCIIQNATQIFHIDRWKPSDLEPAYIVDAAWALMERLLAVLSEDPLSREAQANASLTFQMHVHVMLATCHVLKEFHLN
ncbi:RNA polymerase II largest subunit [Scleroderma citrinum]